MLMNTGTKRIASRHNLLTTVAWRIGDRTEYALEGSIFIAGAVVQWLRDGLELFRSAPEIEALAASVGLTRGRTKAHLARAAREAIALQTKDVLEAMEADSKIKLNELRVDGGA